MGPYGVVICPVIEERWLIAGRTDRHVGRVTQRRRPNRSLNRRRYRCWSVTEEQVTRQAGPIAQCHGLVRLPRLHVIKASTVRNIAIQIPRILARQKRS